jgi:hypothetical protein
VTISSESVFDEKVGRHRMGGDGVWIFLKPLSKGHHILLFMGTDPAYGPDFKTGTDYALIVE